jgi:DNA-binding transcriptional LysR family regulator
MEIAQVEAFLAVATFGSFKRAAEALNLSQPAVSARVAKLERDLGVLLFIRDPRDGVVLSRAGRRFRPYAEQLLRAISRARLAARAGESCPSEILRVASEPYVCNWLLPQALRDFRMRHPTLSLQVTAGSAGWVVDRVRQGECEIGIGRWLEASGLKGIHLLDDPLVLVAKRGQRVPQGRTVDWSDLEHYSFIFVGRGSQDWAVIQSLFDQRGVVPNVALEVESAELALRMVEYGLGLTILPWSCVVESIRLRRVTPVKLREDVLPAVRLRLVYSDDRLEGLVREFAGLVRKAHEGTTGASGWESMIGCRQGGANGEEQGAAEAASEPGDLRRRAGADTR